MKIIIGAGRTSYPGWVSTQEGELNLHSRDWDPNHGMIGRSLQFDTRNRDGKLGMVSIILDARKPVESD